MSKYEEKANKVYTQLRTEYPQLIVTSFDVRFLSLMLRAAHEMATSRREVVAYTECEDHRCGQCSACRGVVRGESDAIRQARHEAYSEGYKDGKMFWATGRSFDVAIDGYAGLPHGLYRMHWRKGGSSLAAVGSDANYRRWFAPVNWVSGSTNDWTEVLRAEYLAISTEVK